MEFIYIYIKFICKTATQENRQIYHWLILNAEKSF